MWKSIPNNSRLVSLGILVLGILSALAVTIPHSPAEMPYVQPDGGVFLYVGQRLLDGAALYREVWDHKPPLIYYLNALGLWATQGSRWGIWVIETIAVAAAAILSLHLLRKSFGIALALLVTAVWLVNFFYIIEDGNLTETFTLPLQFAILALAWTQTCHAPQALAFQSARCSGTSASPRALSTPSPAAALAAGEGGGGGAAQPRHLAHTIPTRARLVLIGILLALIFFLKVNQIGIGIAICAYLLLKSDLPSRLPKFPRLRKSSPVTHPTPVPSAVEGTQPPLKSALLDIAVIILGFFLPTTLILAILAAQNGLYDFWRAVFVFNFFYSQQFEFWSSRFDALTAGYGYLVGTGLIVFALLGFVIGLNALCFARERIAPALRPLLEICALALPIELVLVTTSGRPFDHYFAALLYVLAVWAAFFFYVLFVQVRTLLAAAPPRAQRLAVASIVLLVLLTLLPVLKQDVELSRQLNALEPPAIVQFLRERTTPDDTVLILGHEARILFFAERRSPTRYINASTFQQTPFVTQEMAEEYYKSILDAKPAYIVDLIDRGLVNLTPIDTPFLRRRVGALNQQYKKYGRVGGWTVFERVTPQ